jgi:hypothetical protein
MLSTPRRMPWEDKRYCCTILQLTSLLEIVNLSVTSPCLDPLDQVLRPEVGTQVHDLPAPKPDEQESGTNAEPLDTGVGAFVSIAQLLLALAQVVHLLDNLLEHLLNAAELRLDGLELLCRLDGGPVLGVGANVDVELDGAMVVVVASASCNKSEVLVSVQSMKSI